MSKVGERLWNILAWIVVTVGILFGILPLVVCVVVWLYTGDKNALIAVSNAVDSGVVLIFTYYCLKRTKYRKEDWELYPDLDGLLVGLQFTIAILLYCFTMPLPIELDQYIDNINMTYEVCLLILPLLALSMLAYYSLVLKWRNAIFYARSFILSGVGLLLASILFILSDFKEDGIAPCLWTGLIFLAICTPAIKGLMITFGTNAQKVFPSEKRNTKWYEVLLVLFLALAPILIWETNIF